eukprot:TRINITY_DN324_c0_g1_i1.p1 TRINITY_DN324_c0_g1~~TRINITY_DN324_c0_g1_i1.p1  ORF type:complete len:1220 (+),score=279.85 TRINITY_DN324_c0_g1_i1:138-3797(+)
MASTSFSISSVLEKMTNRDKDFRYMATNDLANELQKDSFKMDADSEKKICAQLILLLDDSSGDVQGLAVKCLGPLIAKIKEQQLQTIVDTLGDHILQNKKETLRDIAGIGLKTVIAQTPPESPTATLIVHRVTPKLIKGISQEDPEIVLECLGVLTDLLKRFATLMDSDHEKIQKGILPHLTSTRVAARKRAISCLGYLSISTPDKLFGDLVSYILGTIEKSKKANHIRTLISVIGAISRSVGYRLGKFLEDKNVIPLLAKYLHDDRFENDDEMRENCFQTFESLVLRCPSEIRPFLPVVIKESLEYIKYDPNVAGDEDEGSDDDEGGSDAEDYSDEEDYSDDDDMSWKVRRSAAKCLAAIIQTRPDILEDLFQKVIPAIVARFKEREENVKLDIFLTFIDVLHQTALVSRSAAGTDSGALGLLKKLIPEAVANLNKELKAKNVKVKTRVGIYQLLKELVSTSPGILSDHVGSLIPGIVSALSGKGTNASTKMEALTCLRLLITTHKPEVIQPHVAEISSPVFAAVSDSYYKITAEALRVSSELVAVIRPFSQSSFDYKPYAKKTYSAIFDKFDAQDIDQEVKESAITCMGLTIAHLGDELGADNLNKALKILLDRLHNEITRLTSVNAIIAIASSPLNIDLRSILNESVKALSDFLRQNNRQLKQASLKALAVLVQKFGKDISSGLFSSVFAEAANLISDADLHLSHLSLRLVEAIIVADPSTIETVRTQLYPKILDLVTSPLLQGLALESLLSLYSSLVTANANKFGFPVLLDSLLSMSGKSLSKQSQSSVAQCVAALCVAAKPEASKTVDRFVDQVKKGKDGNQVQALLCLGEIGRRVDLSSHTELVPVVLSAMDGSEEDKSAASYSLGNICVGNVERFLPSILKEISTSPKKQYLLLHSLEEVISRSTSSGALLPYLKDILNLLFENTECEEEGTRTVVAKCLGKLALISPAELLPALQQRVNEGSTLTRATVVTAVKYAIVDVPHEVDSYLASSITTFLRCLSDKELEVRRSALLTLNYAAHNKPGIIRPILAQHLDALYEETKIKEELIKTVNLGPFKHKVDEGLENRKAAFECMYTLLDSCIDKLDVTVFIKHIVAGLEDVYDIKLLCFLMLSRLAQHAGPALVTSLDSLVEPLRKTLTTKVRDTAVKQQVDRNDELIRSALVAIAAISRLEDVDSSLKFDEFIKQSVKTGQHAEAFDTILKETAPKQVDSV